MPLLLLLVAFSALAQEVELSAPWLTVYDPAGRPRWEVSLERLVRTEDGWQGEGVEVRLYWEGEEEFVLRAPSLSADKRGRRWKLSGNVTGEASGISLACEEAIWDEGLTLIELEARGEDLVLRAASASWTGGKVVELQDVWATTGGWEVELTAATYTLDASVLFGKEAYLVGHGFEIESDRLRLWTDEGRVELMGAHVVPRP